MCGIAGFWDTGTELGAQERPVIAARMRDQMVHRGPDQAGLWEDSENGVAFAFRRLAILDLSPLGEQPMLSPDKRYAIVFNGEIYNYESLKAQVEASGKYPYPFRSTSDTEVLLAAISVWGVAGALPLCNGMFAFALWDRKERTLHLSRDRFGEKPLYYFTSGKRVVFASELKALVEHPLCGRKIDAQAAAHFFQLNYIPAPRSIYEGVFKVPSASFLRFHLNKGELVASKPQTYWSAQETVAHSLRDPFRGTFSEAVEGFESELEKSVRLRMHADVPLGAFLSGGIDSSLVVHQMQKLSDRPVRTFTIGFSDSSFDETPFAARVAKQLGTDHTQRVLTEKAALDLVQELPRIFDEPFADASQIPTILLSRMTREKVTVALSGDGGDEFFGGYNRHIWIDQHARGLGRLPLAVRRWFVAASQGLSVPTWDRLFETAYRVLPQRFHVSAPGQKLRKFFALLQETNPQALYGALTNHWAVSDVITHPVQTFASSLGKHLDDLKSVEKALLFDTLTYLQDDLMVKLDRSSMSASIESRVPFLDPHLFAFAWKLPMEFKIRGGQGKALLRASLRKALPQVSSLSPKRGFELPLAPWLRGPLREWAEALVSPSALADTPWLNAAAVREKWNTHLSGKANCQDLLWSVLMFQAWRKNASKR